MSSSPALATPSTLDPVRDRWTWTAVVANLVGQILIIVTGGAVRLTGSGLGCSTWPQCEPGRFTPEFHEATSIHPFIEFGNRTVSIVLVAIAAAVAVLVVLDRRRPWSYRRLGLVPVVGVVIQAVIGGITVLVDLHPAIVGSHLLISMALVAFSAWLVVRTREGDGPAVPLVDRTTRVLVRVLCALTALVLVLGVVVTGAGPHSGDEEVGYRFQVDPWTMSKLHAASVWAFVAVLVVVLVLLRRRGVTGRPWTTGLMLLAVTLAQGAVGYVQLNTGLPIALVNLHMLGAALLAAAVTFFVGSLRTRDS
ncbi:COX15/CtaA family protein [Cellulomonas fengjieae]|uniref:COX15/CtaA family protein n=1 Tax=Cellulomonas fengjieae TaxID=2819978 RepID=A0ABS3SJI9_9CELL|nr:COX15/CtaA family protein [Cellulomonas fengjieae]MBO3085916.1 COX15/CtaA family protein [Cellulomonas fengjieae]QVI67391.1 COX15/CtaA family protein [Cellulomonas fengjieae]